MIVFTGNHCPDGKVKFDELNDLAVTYDMMAVEGINSNEKTKYPADSIERMQAYVEEGTIPFIGPADTDGCESVPVRPHESRTQTATHS